MAKGWVYVITNKAMPGLVKVGYSMKDPELRAQELNHTGSPHPYEVEYDALVDEPRDIEAAAHKMLASYSEGKEWFRCTPADAVGVIRDLSRDCLKFENYRKVDRERVERLEQERLAAQRAAAQAAEIAAQRDSRQALIARQEKDRQQQVGIRAELIRELDQKLAQFVRMRDKELAELAPAQKFLPWFLGISLPVWLITASLAEGDDGVWAALFWSAAFAAAAAPMACGIVDDRHKSAEGYVKADKKWKAAIEQLEQRIVELRGYL